MTETYLTQDVCVTPKALQIEDVKHVNFAFSFQNVLKTKQNPCMGVFYTVSIRVDDVMLIPQQ